MPLRNRQRKALYSRGQYLLGWDQKSDGSLRSPYLSVFWYDSKRRRVRSASTGTADIDDGKTWLDAFYLERTTGKAVCFHCGQFKCQVAGHLVSAAIADYLEGTVPGKPSEDAIRARLDHVLDYIEQDDLNVICDQVNDLWVARFRSWSQHQPVVSTAGKVLRERSIATTEASVAQLSAAINDAERRKNTTHRANFRAFDLRTLNNSPEHRSDLAELAMMFRYCVAPSVKDEDERARRIRERASLYRFLITSVATWARPDAAHDLSIDPKRAQWSAKARVVNLNPKGRRQTKKFRAMMPCPWQLGLWLDHAHDAWLELCELAKREKKPAPSAYFVGPKSVRKAWEGMAAELKLPDEGEAGLKLIRRSMATIARARLGEESWIQGRMWLGHVPATTSDIYALRAPENMGKALTVTETIIDELEALTPGAFALPGGKVVTLGRKA